MKLISFVIPCYRSEKTIKMVAQEIVETVSARPEYDYEIITVNDCSPDNVLSVLEELAEQNPKFKVIDLMQNGGKEAAVMAGLSVAKGDFAITMDDDFQHPATEVWRLIEPIETGKYDVGTAYYDIKKESWLKRTCSDIYGYFSHTMLGQPKDIRLDSFMALSQKVYLEMLNYSAGWKKNAKIMYNNFKNRDEFPQRIIYIDFGYDDCLSIETEWEFNDWVNSYYDFVEEEQINEMFRAKIYNYNGSFDGDYSKWTNF